MTTLSPAHYRDILKLINENYPYGTDIPEWFRTAWQQDQVKTWPYRASPTWENAGYQEVNFSCHVDIDHMAISMLLIQFQILTVLPPTNPNRPPYLSQSAMSFITHSYLPHLIKSYSKEPLKYVVSYIAEPVFYVTEDLAGHVSNSATEFVAAKPTQLLSKILSQAIQADVNIPTTQYVSLGRPGTGWQISRDKTLRFESYGYTHALFNQLQPFAEQLYHLGDTQ